MVPGFGALGFEALGFVALGFGAPGFGLLGCEAIVFGAPGFVAPVFVTPDFVTRWDTDFGDFVDSQVERLSTENFDFGTVARPLALVGTGLSPRNCTKNTKPNSDFKIQGVELDL